MFSLYMFFYKKKGTWRNDLTRASREKMRDKIDDGKETVLLEGMSCFVILVTMESPCEVVVLVCLVKEKSGVWFECCCQYGSRAGTCRTYFL